MMKLTKDDLEVTRKWWLEKSTSPEHASLVVQICDAALQALSQPKDVKRPKYHGAWVEDGGQWVVKKIDYDALMDYATSLEQPTAQGWCPISEAELHVPIIAGLWVNDKHKGLIWESFLGSVNDLGYFVNEDGEDFTGWALEDFDGFQPLPQPPRSEVSNG